MLRLVIFDLDGTLLDTLSDLRTALNRALTAAGLPPRTQDEVRRFVGNGIPKLIERAVPAGCPAETQAAVLADFTAYYKVHCADETWPYDGIPALLSALREKGIAVAVVSNKADYAVQSLCAGFFPGLVDVAVGERPGVRKKPCPDSVNEVLSALGADGADAVYVGDSDVDLRTAENAGLRAVSVLWGFRDEAFLRANGARRLVSDADQLKKLLFSL